MTSETHLHNRLLIFARCPVPGRVKTRLIPALGIEKTTRLYIHLLAYTLDQAQRYASATPELWVDSPVQAPGCQELLNRYAIGAYTQANGDLGRRMQRALDCALMTARKAVLIGTDCPDLTTQVLDTAFAALDDSDAVVGPAIDGGYALLGMRKTDSRLFDAIPWGSEQVMAKTRERLGQLGWTWQELPPVQDIDEPKDLTHPFVQSALAASET